MTMTKTITIHPLRRFAPRPTCLRGTKWTKTMTKTKTVNVPAMRLIATCRWLKVNGKR